ncbi:MAG: hypothetical protein JXB48_01570 [Candidatus Latescibacteria bacterium]|nr:hypothetical protein [Candidatus Latescibacterota bacterium]
MNNQDYKHVRDLYSLAEKRIKLIEQLDSEIVIPAINQLRYVGWHILESLFSDESYEDNIKEAEIHASRAAYDAIEAGTLELLLEFAQFKNDFRFITIGDVIPDYLEICEKIDNTRDILSNLNNRQQCNMHEELQTHFEELLNISRRFAVAREELTKKLRNWRLWVFFGLGAIFLTLFGIIVMMIFS